MIGQSEKNTLLVGLQLQSNADFKKISWNMRNNKSK